MPIRRRSRGSDGGQFKAWPRCEQVESEVPVKANAVGRTMISRDELLARYANGERDFTCANLAGAKLSGDATVYALLAGERLTRRSV